MRFSAYTVIAMMALALARWDLGAAERPIDVIEDNSFLVEEAYNQEPGEVQHVVTAAYNDPRRRGWTFDFTQEWPVFSQDHQFSYTIPSYHLHENGDRIFGIGDVSFKYPGSTVRPTILARFSIYRSSIICFETVGSATRITGGE